jgi:TrmH family RNA methyltransferase
VWRSLLRSKGRGETGLFLVEGPRVVRELLDSALRVQALLYSEPEPESLRELVGEFRDAEVPCQALSESLLASVSDAQTPQGVIAVAVRPSWDWADLGSGDLVVMDSIQDPGNVGTLLRAAEGLGFSGAIVLPGTAEVWSPKVTRAAAGSSLRLPIVEASWTDVGPWLEGSERELWCADSRGEPLGRSRASRPPVALVLGNEGAGVSDAVLSESVRTISVPLQRPVDSLNVGVAGAILMDRLREGPSDG